MNPAQAQYFNNFADNIIREYLSSKTANEKGITIASLKKKADVKDILQIYLMDDCYSESFNQFN